MAAKDGIRVKEFFIDFDKLRKGTVGEAAVSYNFYLIHYSSVPVLEPSILALTTKKSKLLSTVTAKLTDSFTTLLSSTALTQFFLTKSTNQPPSKALKLKQ